MEAIWSLDLFVNVGIQIWPLDHNLKAIWPLDLFINVEIQIWPSITIWKQSGHWISLLTLGFKSGSWINTGVIWAVRSRWRERGDFSPKIGDISPINRRFTGFSGDLFIKSPIYRLSPIYHLSPIYRRYIVDFWRKIAPSTYLPHMSFRSPPTCDISAIFR